MGFLTPAKLDPEQLGVRRLPRMSERLLGYKLRDESMSLDTLRQAIAKERRDLCNRKVGLKIEATADLEVLQGLPSRSPAQNREVAALMTLVTTLSTEIIRLNQPLAADGVLSRLLGQ